MKFWTTQSEKVISYILNDGIYYPDFSLSNGLGGSGMKGGYNGLLEEYNQRNSTNCRGLVFGITKLEDEPIYTLNQYRDYFTKNPTFWDSVSRASTEYALLELEISDGSDIIPIYFQDFIVIGMRAIKDTDFTAYVKPGLKNQKFQDFKSDLQIAQSEGWISCEDYYIEHPLFGRSLIEALLNKITQAHFHQIALDNIKGVHETYDFNNNTAMPLGANALKLRQLISEK